MSIGTGTVWGVVLIGFIALWLLIDLALWLLGLQTFSQWVIIHATDHVSFAVVATIVIVGGAVLLVWHFDLIQILLRHLGWL